VFQESTSQTSAQEDIKPVFKVSRFFEGLQDFTGETSPSTNKSPDAITSHNGVPKLISIRHSWFPVCGIDK